MKEHQMKLTSVPFEAIKDGNKIIESRLYDEKRRDITVGDKIIFSNTDNPTQTVTAEVVELLCYPTFQELFEANNPQDFGGVSVESLLTQIHQFYSEEEEQKYSVVGIKLTLK